MSDVWRKKNNFSTYIALWCLTFHFLFFLVFGAQVCTFCVSPNFAFSIFHLSVLPFMCLSHFCFLLFVSHFCSFGVSPVLPFTCLSHFFIFFSHFFFAFCVSLPLLLSSLILPHPCGSLPGKFHLRGYYQRSRKMRKNVSSTLTNTTTLRLILFRQQPQQNTKHDIQSTKVLQSAGGGKTPKPKKSHF